MAKAEFDVELKKAFAAQQLKLVETRQRLKLADVQIEALNKSIARSHLTAKEIQALPSDTKTYESTGRMFTLRSIPEVKKSLEKRITNCEGKISKIENNKSFFERSLQESENNLREMVQQRKYNMAD